MLLTGWARLAGRSSSGYKCLEDVCGADDKTRGQPEPTPTYPLARQAQPVAAIGEASRAHFGPSLAQQGRKTSSQSPMRRSLSFLPLFFLVLFLLLMSGLFEDGG